MRCSRLKNSSKGFAFLFVLASCVLGINVSAQLGPDSYELKWKQINTPLVRVIFPDGQDPHAKKVVANIQALTFSNSENFQNKKKKIDIVLQEKSTESNGYVALAPFKSEFILTPPQNSLALGSTPWIDLLSVHEFRHVQQYNNLDVGISRAAHVLFGQAAQSFMASMAVPNWFFEGDAVYNETRFSEQGRGRLPSFFTGYKALWKDGKNYNWMKLRNGSLKDFVPNHYPLGYMLVAYGRDKYGADFWKNVVNDAAHFNGLFYAFQKAVKKYSGEEYPEFVNHAFDYYKNELGVSPNPNPSSNSYLDQTIPVFTEEGDLIYIENSFSSVPKFVSQNGDQISSIRTMDNAVDLYFSYKNGKIVYAAFRPDIRRSNVNYNEIQILDVHNGNQYTLTHRTEYFSPDINQSGDEVIAVHVDATESSLDFIEVPSGQITRSIKAPNGSVFCYPKYLSEDKVVVMEKNSQGKMGLISIDKITGNRDTLLPFSNHPMAFPVVAGDTLFFTMAYQGNNSLMAYSLSNRKLNLVETKNIGSVGAFHPAAKNDAFVFYSFTSAGNRLYQVKKDELKLTPISLNDLQQPLEDFGISSTSTIPLNINLDSFKIEDYHKGSHMINFHSLQATMEDPVYQLSWLSDDVMSTTSAEVYFNYNRSDRSKALGASISYGGLFPIITSGINYTFHKSVLYHGSVVDYTQLQPYFGVQVPLNLSKGRSLMGMNFGSNGVYNQTNYLGNYKDSIASNPFFYLSNFISFYHQTQKAPQQINPSWGQSLILSYKLPLNEHKGYQFSVNSNFYFPSFAKNHSIVFNSAYVTNDKDGTVHFSSDFPFSRGYSAINFLEMNKWGINYHLPLLYPDAGFSNIFYLLRVRANFFYDETHAKDLYANHTIFKGTFRSAGAEMYFDTKWWNVVGTSFGIRYSYLLDQDLTGNNSPNRWEILLPLTIF